MNYLCELRWESSCELRKISHIELNFLTIKLIQKKNTCVRVFLKIKLQALRLHLYQKTDPEKSFSCHLCKIFKSTSFYWTPPVAASSYYKTSGFTEAVMQMNFWTSYNLVHINILSSNWHFCVCFWRPQAFFCISTASFTFEV